MKSKIKLFLIVASLGWMSSSIKAQAIDGTELRNTTMELIPELDLQNKILFVNLWKSDDLESRENNKEFLRVSNIYKQGKLKNGTSGVAYINLCLDNELYNWIVSVKKDGIESPFNLENSSQKYKALIKYFDGKTGNIVIGNDGSIIGENLKKDDCFILFRSLITR